MNDEFEGLDFGDENYDPTELTPVSVEIDDGDGGEPIEEPTVIDNEEDDGVTPPAEPDESGSEENDLLIDLLKAKGISDPSAIKYKDDNGEIKEVDFNDLSREEQLNILNSSDVDDNYGLEDDETEFISYLRDNNVSVNDYLDYVRREAIEQFVAANNVPHYAVDDLSDEELYVLDLQANLKDVTEEEAKQYLDHEKANELLWNKKIQVLRDNYKAKEQAQIEEQQLIEQQKEQEEQEKFINSMTEAINGLERISRFDLEDEDRAKILEFVLGEDVTGTNYLMKALSDPETVAKMAWFILDGQESVEALNNYWANQVQEHSRNGYDEGYKDAKSGKKSKVNTKRTPTTSKKTTNTKQTSSKFISLEDYEGIDID